jgi:lipoprotein-anchoring transpeptidase ErfK/SrfK
LWSYRFRLAKKYPIAIGKKGYESPSGFFLINSRSKCPEWRMPDSDWVAKELRGTVLSCKDPANPIKARWLGVTDPKDGIGIHGTADDASIGTAASHGCFRMHVDDVIDLFGRVKLYSPVVIL